jgi:ABC-type multidrug transport system fused ATPase/permease subunit
MIVYSVVIASGLKYVVFLLPLFCLAFYVVQMFYLRTSRQLRHLDLEAKAPLLVHFSETASGLEHIRSFGWQSKRMKRGFTLLDAAQKPFYYSFTVKCWLFLVLDLVSLATSIVIVTFAVCYTQSTTMAGVGLSLMFLNDLSGTICFFLEKWTELETALSAVARIRWFCESTPLEVDVADSVAQVLPRRWPSRGEVVFGNVTARYE